jgi:hypothetical protein
MLGIECLVIYGTKWGSPSKWQTRLNSEAICGYEKLQSDLPSVLERNEAKTASNQRYLMLSKSTVSSDSPVLLQSWRLLGHTIRLQ